MNLAKLLLLGAGFLAYRYYEAAQDDAPSSPGGIIPADTPALPAPAPPVTNPATTRDLVLAEAAKQKFTLGSVHQWNWFYLQARGVAPPSPDQWGLTPADDNRQMTFDEWWNLASSHGLSGIVPFHNYGAPMVGPNEVLLQPGPGGYRMVG